MNAGGKMTLIRQATAVHYDVPLAELDSPSKARTLIRPRYAAMHLARKIGGASLQDIGRAFKRDHSTVLHALRSIDRWLETDTILMDDLTRIVQLVDLNEPWNINKATDALASHIADILGARIAEAEGRPATRETETATPTLVSAARALAAALQSFETEQFGKHEQKALERLLQACHGVSRQLPQSVGGVHVA